MTSTSLFPLVGWIRCLWHETFEVRTVLEHLVVGSCLVPTEMPLGDCRCPFVGTDSVPRLESPTIVRRIITSSSVRANSRSTANAPPRPDRPSRSLKNGSRNVGSRSARRDVEGACTIDGYKAVDAFHR